MPCYHPIRAVQQHAGGPLSFPREEHLYMYAGWKKFHVPCGQCFGCRLKRSRDWAIRCLHEAKMHRYNCFLTLTYNDKHLPANKSLKHRDFQLFMKRMRKAISKSACKPTAFLTEQKDQQQCAPGAPPKPVAHPLRFYMAGEYGERHGRPHYHALIFGLDFADKKYLQRTPSGGVLYTSATLKTLWPHGYSSIGELTFETAAYVSRYVMKKINGNKVKKNERIDASTGEILQQTKEYNCMSRAGGIGIEWLRKYHTDLHNNGKVLINGHEANQPRYYDKFIKRLDPLLHERHKLARLLEAESQKEHHTPERLAIQEIVAKAKTRTLKRNLEG